MERKNEKIEEKKKPKKIVFEDDDDDVEEVKQYSSDGTKEIRRPARRYEETKLYIQGADFPYARQEVLFALQRMEEAVQPENALVPGQICIKEGQTEGYVWVLSEHAERFIARPLTIKDCLVTFSYKPLQAKKPAAPKPVPSMLIRNTVVAHCIEYLQLCYVPLPKDSILNICDCLSSVKYVSLFSFVPLTVQRLE
jgi:hypothetical protein